MNSKKILILIVISLSATGCTAGRLAYDPAKPFLLSTTPPPGPPEYVRGWKDGCESAIASTNSSFFMTVGTHRFTLDNKLRYDALYNKAWRYGYNHCGYSMKSLAQYNF